MSLTCERRMLLLLVKARFHAPADPDAGTVRSTVTLCDFEKLRYIYVQALPLRLPSAKFNTMPLIQSSSDTLPHIDPVPASEALASANALVEAELAKEDQSNLHASIPEYPGTKYSQLIDTEHARLAAGEAKDGGIDLSRYEALDAPERGDLEAWKAALQQAYASLEYLHGREINLSLLETYGKNSWLIGNNQLEDILRNLEREVEASKLELGGVEQERKRAQENVGDEMRSLEDTWRKGIGRMIETQAAVEGLKQEILQRKRIAAT